MNMDSVAADKRASLLKIVDAVHFRDERIPDSQFEKLDNGVGSFLRTLVNITRKRLASSAVTRPPVSQKDGGTETMDPEHRKRSDAKKKSLCPDKLLQMARYYCSLYRPHAVVAEYIFTAPCLDVVPQGTLKLIDTHDMFSRKKEQVLSHGLEDLFSCTPEEERDFLVKGDVIIAIQEDEARMFRQLVDRRKVVSVGIDYEVTGEVDNSRMIPGLVLVVGSDNPLNVHGLKEFHGNAWPLIRRVNPEAVLRVIGKLGNAFQTDDESVEVAGWVENLDDEYKRACVVINPTVAGTGLKIKSVEALCRTKPLVATPNSVEGLVYEGEPPFIIGHDWHEFADAVRRLLRSESERGKLQERARHFALQNYGTEQVYAPLAPFFPRIERAADNAFEKLFGTASRAITPTNQDRELFDNSTPILILPDPESGFDGLRPLHQVDVSLKSAIESPVLTLHASGEDPCVELPIFSFPARTQLIMKVDITSQTDTIFQIYYKEKGAIQYSESMSITRPISKGRNELCIPLPHNNLHGNLRVDPGKTPGDYLLHSIEIRAAARQDRRSFTAC
jgi:glycosyltransferase involved in cell wall biosynthesis